MQNLLALPILAFTLYIIYWLSKNMNKPIVSWNFVIKELAKNNSLKLGRKGVFTRIAEGEFEFGRLEVRVRSLLKDLGLSKVLSLRLVFAPDRLRDFSLSPIGTWFEGNRDGRHEAILIGDNRFDNHFSLSAVSIDKALVPLCPAAREFYARFCEKDYVERLFVEDGVLTLLLSHHGDRYNTMENIYDQFMKLAALLAKKGEARDLLIENYDREKNSAVRINYLKALYILGVKLPEDHAIISESQASENIDMVFAGLRLIDPGRDDRLPELYRRAHSRLRIGICEYAGAKKLGEHLEFFIWAAKNEPYEENKIAVAEYFGALGDVRAKDFLLSQISVRGKKDRDYKHACIEALGFCGDYSCIEILFNKREDFDKLVVDRAIQRIQERIGAGDGGWLSLSESGAQPGNLSRAGDKK